MNTLSFYFRKNVSRSHSETKTKAPGKSCVTVALLMSDPMDHPSYGGLRPWANFGTPLSSLNDTIFSRHHSLLTVIGFHVQNGCLKDSEILILRET